MLTCGANDRFRRMRRARVVNDLLAVPNHLTSTTIKLIKGAANPARGQTFSDCANAGCNVGPSGVTVRPRCHRRHACRQPLQFSEWRALPIARPQQHRNDDRLLRGVTFQRSLHFIVPAVVRRDEVCADEQEDDGRSLEPLSISRSHSFPGRIFRSCHVEMSR